MGPTSYTEAENGFFRAHEEDEAEVWGGNCLSYSYSIVWVTKGLIGG